MGVTFSHVASYVPCYHLVDISIHLIPIKVFQGYCSYQSDQQRLLYKPPWQSSPLKDSWGCKICYPWRGNSLIMWKSQRYMDSPLIPWNLHLLCIKPWWNRTQGSWPQAPIVDHTSFTIYQLQYSLSYSYVCQRRWMIERIQPTWHIMLNLC